MTKFQYYTIAICLLMNILDGIDVLIISYSAPDIISNLNINPKELGVVFSGGLLGMAIGALFLAPYADIIGRKKIIIISAVIMGSCIVITAFTENITQLVLIRIITGVGIGSMLATTATLISECVPKKSKDFWVSVVLSGYPIGAVLSGYVATIIIPTYGWRTLFLFAGFSTLLTIPIIYIFLDESVEFYLKKQPKDALNKVNQILTKMKLSKLEKLPKIKLNNNSKKVVSKLFSDTYKISTLLLWASLFFSFGCLYFLISWIPKLSTDAGLSIELAIYAGTIFNVGAFFGIILQGYCSSKFGLKKTISFFFLMTFLLMSTFKIFVGSNLIFIIFLFLGFSLQGGFVGLYAIAASLYSTEIKSTGVGWAIGIGRFGAIAGPLIGGYFVSMNYSISTNFLIFSLTALFAALLTYFIPSKNIS